MCHGIMDFKYVVNSDVVNADDLIDDVNSSQLGEAQ